MEKIDSINENNFIHPEATPREIEELCAGAIASGSDSVYANPNHLPRVKKCLLGTKVKAATIIGWPRGSQSTSTKLYEAQEALNAGAEEIDVVMNMDAFYQGDYGLIEQELVDFRRIAKDQVLKVIIDTTSLKNSELITAVQLATEANADFIKTYIHPEEKLTFAPEPTASVNLTDVPPSPKNNHRKTREKKLGGILVMKTESISQTKAPKKAKNKRKIHQ